MPLLFQAAASLPRFLEWKASDADTPFPAKDTASSGEMAEELSSRTVRGSK